MYFGLVSNDCFLGNFLGYPTAQKTPRIYPGRWLSLILSNFQNGIAVFSWNTVIFRRGALYIFALGFRFLWPFIVSKVWRERKPTRCNNQMFIINTFSTCFGHHYAHLRKTKTCVTARGVLCWFCWMCLVAVVGRCVVGCEHCEGYCSHCSHPTRQRPTTATNHIQQNQYTIRSNTRSLFSWRWA